MRYRIIRHPYALARPVFCTAIDHEGEKDINPIGWHSNEFEFGYGGSGPAELALAILADWFGERISIANMHESSIAWDLHQEFKWRFIATQFEDEFEIDEMELALFCFAEVSV